MNEPEKKTLCVAGASGLVGSNITRAALLKGYRVKGTMRDCADNKKAPFLKALEGGDRLNLLSADMSIDNDFDEATRGVDCVFIATLIPVYEGPTGKPAKDMDDEQGYREIILPTVNGCLNIMRSAVRNGVNKIVICSSTSSTNPIPSVLIKNEIDHWSDEKAQCLAKKYTSATKTVMEKAALKFGKEHDIRLSIIMPTGMFGPVIIPEHMDRNPHVWLRRAIEGGKGRHEKVPNDSTSMSHLYDLANLFLAAYENPEARDRYFGVYGSWHWQDIYGELKRILPDMQMPLPIIEPAKRPTQFDFTRRNSLGVSFRDIQACLKETVEWIQTKPFD